MKTIDEIKVEYLDLLDAGSAPPMDEFIRRYPQFSGDLVEFIVTAIELSQFERALSEPDSGELSPRVREAIRRGMELQAAELRGESA